MAIGAAELKALLGRIDANLASGQTVCLIGSGATILLGQPARATDDLDVWHRANRFDPAPLREAVEAAGLGFDPKDEFPTVPYVQIVHPGIVQVPGWNPRTRTWFGKPEEHLWMGRHLRVTCPPPEAIAASKLIRGSDRDLEDCIWLMAARGIDARAINTAIRKLPEPQKSQAADNLGMLSILRR